MANDACRHLGCVAAGRAHGAVVVVLARMGDRAGRDLHGQPLRSVRPSPGVPGLARKALHPHKFSRAMVVPVGAPPTHAGFLDRLLGDTHDDGWTLAVLDRHDGLHPDRHATGRTRPGRGAGRRIPRLPSSGTGAATVAAPAHDRSGAAGLTVEQLGDPFANQRALLGRAHLVTPDAAAQQTAECGGLPCDAAVGVVLDDGVGGAVWEEKRLLAPAHRHPEFRTHGPLTAATKVLTGIFAARRDGVARRGQLRAGTALIARGEFSLIIIGLVGTSVTAVAALATSYVFVMAIVGPMLARLVGGPLPDGAGPAQ